MKSLLLGAVAGIAAIGAAQAADLPMTKGEAVEYVKVCSTFGPGFFYIPGSDTCLKIGGEIRADYRAYGRSGSVSGPGITGIPGAGGALGALGLDSNRDDNRTAFGTQGRIWFDARTQTDYGLLRSYFQINASGNTATTTGTGSKNDFSVDKAFIQFGGLTAGYAHSFFGFYDNEWGDTIWAPYYAESSTVNLLAYTAQFGGGFSATLSIEDGRDHRVDNVGVNIPPISASIPFQGGQQFPDVVAQLRYDQDWGSVAIQGALHQLRTGEGGADISVGGVPLPIPGGTIAFDHENKWGYAVGATGLIKLPFIDGGHFIVEGQYADGATEYLGINSSKSSILGRSDLFPTNIVAGGTGVTISDFDTTSGWSIVAELGGNITPVLNANLVGSYIDTKYDNVLGNVAGLAGGLDISIKEYTIAGNLTYTIVKGLTVAGEVSYTNQKQEFGPIELKQDSWTGGVRLKRTF